MKEKNEKHAFEDIDKDIKILKPEFFTDNLKEVKTDWIKLSKAVLALLKPNLTQVQYNLISIAIDVLLKKKSRFSMFISISFITTVQIYGVISVVKLIVNLVHLIVTKIYPI